MLISHNTTSEAHLAASSGIPINACNEAPRSLFSDSSFLSRRTERSSRSNEKNVLKHSKRDARKVAQKSFKLLPTHSNLPVDDLPLRRLQAQDATRLRRSNRESESTHVEPLDQLVRLLLCSATPC